MPFQNLARHKIRLGRLSKIWRGIKFVSEPIPKFGEASESQPTFSQETRKRAKSCFTDYRKQKQQNSFKEQLPYKILIEITYLC